MNSKWSKLDHENLYYIYSDLNIYMHIPKWYIPSYNNSSREGMLNRALDVQGPIKLILLNIKINR